MSDKISGIGNLSPYNGRNNSNSNEHQRKKESNKGFDEIYNDLIDLSPNTPVTKGVKFDNKYNVNIETEEVHDYPIKYASIPIYFTSSKKDIVGFIASKCFVVEEIINYYPNNEIKHSYKIVSPFDSLVDTFPKMNYPIFDNEKCINSFETKDVFDNYKLAKDSATEKNKKMNIDSDMINMLDKYEEIIFNKTDNMLINKGEYKRKI